MAYTKEKIMLALEDCLYVAALLVRRFAEYPEVIFRPEQLVREAGVPFSRTSEALGAVEKLIQLGLCIPSGSCIKPRSGMRDQWSGIAYMLEGALVLQNIRRERDDGVLPRLVVTTPRKEGRFVSLIKENTGLYVRTSPTSDVFRNLAEKSKHRFVVMTPFLDREGAIIVRDLFKRTGSKTEKHLVLRFLNHPELGGCVRGIKDIKGDLDRMNVLLHDFTILHDDGSLESFHAKIVCSDFDSAYVGSANQTKEYSIEMGLLVFGETAKRVAESLDIVLDLATVVETFALS